MWASTGAESSLSSLRATRPDATKRVRWAPASRLRARGLGCYDDGLMSPPRGRKTAPYDMADKLDADPARLQQLLAETNAERLSLKNQVRALEQQLQRSADQQDSFVAGLLEEHERAVAQIRAELDKALAARAQNPARAREVQTAPAVPRNAAGAPKVVSDEELERLLQERDRSRELLRRLQAQRDEAQSLAQTAVQRVAELEAQLALPPTAPPPGAPAARKNQDGITTSPTTKRAPSRDDMPVMRGRVPVVPELDLDIGRPTRRGGSSVPPKRPASRRPPPPDASDSQPPGQVAVRASDLPPLKSKPNPAEHPLGRYSLRPGSVAPERLRGNRSRRR